MQLIDQYKVICDVHKYFQRFKYITDIDKYDLTDVWRPVGFDNNEEGDCEDFALGYYALLRAYGFTERELSIAICRTGHQHHAVCLVTIRTGTYVLDCRMSEVLPYRSPLLRISHWYYSGKPFSRAWNRIKQPTEELLYGTAMGKIPLSEKIKHTSIVGIVKGLQEFQSYMKDKNNNGLKRLSKTSN